MASDSAATDSWRPSSQACPLSSHRSTFDRDEDDRALDERQLLDRMMNQRDGRSGQPLPHTASQNGSELFNSSNQQQAGEVDVDIDQVSSIRQSTPTAPISHQHRCSKPDATALLEVLSQALSIDHTYRSHLTRAQSLETSSASLKSQLNTAKRQPHKVFIDRLHQKISETEEALRITHQDSNEASTQLDALLRIICEYIIARPYGSIEDTRMTELECRLQEESEKRLDERAIFRKQIAALEAALADVCAGPQVDGIANKVEALNKGLAKHDHAIMALNDRYNALVTDSLQSEVSKLVHPYFLAVKDMETKIKTSTAEVCSQIQLIQSERTKSTQKSTSIQTETSQLDEKMTRLESNLDTIKHGLNDLHQLVHQAPTKNDMQQITTQTQSNSQAYLDLKHSIQQIEVKVADQVQLVADLRNTERVLDESLNSIDGKFDEIDGTIQDLESGQKKMSAMIGGYDSQSISPIRDTTLRQTTSDSASGGTQAHVRDKKSDEAGSRRNKDKTMQSRKKKERPPRDVGMVSSLKHSATRRSSASPSMSNSSREVEVVLPAPKFSGIEKMTKTIVRTAVDAEQDEGASSMKRKLDDWAFNNTDESTTPRKSKKSHKKRKPLPEIISVDD